MLEQILSRTQWLQKHKPSQRLARPLHLGSTTGYWNPSWKISPYAPGEKQLELYNLQKDTISTQKQSGCKKSAGLFKNGQCEKSCEIKGAAKKWLWWYRLMAKILITTIQVNLCCLIPASLGISTKFTWIVVIKFCHQPIPSQPFLGHPFDITTFFTLAIFEQGCTFFYSQAVFE